MESSSPLEDNRLGPAVCAPLARQRLNLTFFTHVAGDREVLCTASHNGEAALTLLQSQADPAGSLALQPGTSILAVYPHDKRPEVIGTFIKSLARARVVIHGLASSPSAISVVLSSRRIKPAVEQLFEHFTFPGFASPQEFFSAQAPPKEYLEKVVATYQEKVNKVYWIIPQPDLDLWGMSIATADILAGLCHRPDGDGPTGPGHTVSGGPAGARGPGIHPVVFHGPAPTRRGRPRERSPADFETAICRISGPCASPRWRGFFSMAPISATATASPTPWLRPWKRPISNCWP